MVHVFLFHSFRKERFATLKREPPTTFLEFSFPFLSDALDVVDLEEEEEEDVEAIEE